MKRYFGDTAILLYLAFIKLILQLLVNARDTYGYFRDEFYYLACSRHLDLGYVDHPPFSEFLLAINSRILGDSLVALRFLPAVAGASMVFLTGYLCRELGGKRFAQILAALSVLVAGSFLGSHSYYSMNAFDQLFWLIAVYFVVRAVKTENPVYWIYFGLVAGIGLLNKISMLFLGFGLVVGLLVTPERRYLFTRGPWLGAILAFLLFFPNIFWQMSHGWPTLEFMENAQRYKNFPIAPLDFFLGQVLELTPATIVIWLAGLYWFLFAAVGKRYRFLGIAYLSIFILFVVQKAKVYYLAPAYPMLFAAGAIAWEHWIDRFHWDWLKPGLVAILLLGGMIIAPFGIPVLPVETFLRYQAFLGFKPPQGERMQQAELPQFYADRFGWEEMVQAVARVYQNLSPEEKTKCVIYGQNYGEAGAVDFFGKKYGLPNAVSGHNNYWLWGPGTDSIQVVIIIGGNREDHLEGFEEVEQMEIHSHKYSMPYESNLPIFVCRKLKVPIEQIWPQTREYI